MLKLMLVVTVLCLSACSKKDDKAAKGSTAPAGSAETKAAGGGGGDCLVGTYERDDAGVTKKMIFNADKTGVDDKGDEKSNFTWSLKDDKTVHVKYLAEGDSVGGEFDMPFNCANETFYTLYKKKK
jgi:hypothetical protein